MEGIRLKRLKVDNQDPEAKRDYLSELPQHLLHHILSFLTMKDVIRTSVLGRRWKYLWVYVPCLNFSVTEKPRVKEMAFITRSLLLHMSPNIEKLSISFKCRRSDALQLTSWIDFASRRNVRELYLDFRVKKRDAPFYSRQRLPQIVFSCRSLTVLSLKRCDIDLREDFINFKLGSLKILTLEQVNLVGGAISDLISSSPILEYLSLTDFSPKDNVDLLIKNVHMKTLKIHEFDECSPSSILVVNAPYIVSFELVTNMSRKNYVIGTMQSLESATLDCLELVACYRKLIAKDKRRTIVKILDKLYHARDLRLSGCYLRALSLRGDQSLGFRSFDATHLYLKTGTKGELPGIAYILRHSPNVETLNISIGHISKGLISRLNEKSSGENLSLRDLNLTHPMHYNMKTVKVFNFLKNVNVTRRLKEILTANQLQSDMKLLTHLLENSNVLERMIVATCQDVNKVGRERKKARILAKLTPALLQAPRASPDAEISFV